MTPKQERFVREYLIDLNATKAAERAGYSPKTANEQGARLLANVSIRAAVAMAQAERAVRTQIDADYVLKGLKEEAEFRGEGSSHSARVSALGLLGKHLGMFVDRHEHSTPGVLRVVKEIVCVEPAAAGGPPVPAAEPVPG